MRIGICEAMSFLLRMCMRTASELAGLVTLLAVDRDGGGIVTDRKTTFWTTL